MEITCSKCSASLEAGHKFCGTCGAPIEPGKTEQTLSPFIVQPAKLLVMSVLTLGLYDIFWMFKQWSYIRSRDESSIRPFWRALFSVFFIKSLFSEFKAPNGLAWALVYYGLALCSRLPGNWAFITLLEVLPLYALQSHINDEFNVRRAGGRYSKKAVTVCVLGGLIWVLVVIGTIWT